MEIKYYVICCLKGKLTIDYLNKFSQFDFQNYSSFEDALVHFNKIKNFITNEDYGLFIYINNQYWIKTIPHTKNYIAYTFDNLHYYKANNIQEILNHIQKQYFLFDFS